MKIIKRIATMILSVMLVVPMFSAVAEAAGESVIFFSDLETTVGAKFTVTGTVVSRVGELGDVSVEMQYDPSFMQFVSGDGVSDGGNGKLTFTGSGSAGNDRLEFSVEFQALQEGSTRIEQGATSVKGSDGNPLECDAGYADINVGPGDPSLIVPQTSTATVEIDGQEYTISGDFTNAMIPQGFSEGEFTYNESTFRGALQPNAGITLAYLTDSTGGSDFWVYDAEDDRFTQCEEMMISDTYSILIMDGTKAYTLPDEYEESLVQISGKEIPAWLDPNREGFSILYGVNSDGDTSLYLYDTLEHTYQRMETPKKVAENSDDKGTTAGVWSKIESFVTDYMLWVVVGIACLLVILLIFLLVLAIKLGNRNRELDDLYEEFGIDSEVEEPVKVKKAKKSPKKKTVEDDYDEEELFFDDTDDYYDDGDAYDDEGFDEDELIDLKREFESLKQPERSYDEYYDDDDFEEEVVKKSPKRRKATREDTFQMDFIDLD